MSEINSRFGDYHEMVHIWTRIQAFDHGFKIPTVQICKVYWMEMVLLCLSQKVVKNGQILSMQKINPWAGSIFVTEGFLYTFISCYLKKIIKIGFPEPEKKFLQRFCSVFVN